jgi:hypothetical protein
MVELLLASLLLRVSFLLLTSVMFLLSLLLSTRLFLLLLLASLLNVASFCTDAVISDVDGVYVVVGLSSCWCRLHYFC